ncbi:unnamed protein product [Amoebophrya sp. A25]|nr:unnamed protein product [Amoebophrya sp. A25]|eukprot:GSA25T00011630001.1
MAEQVLQKVNAYCEKIPVLQKVATQCGVKPALIVCVVVAFFVPFLLFGIGSSTISLIVGGIIPGYMSFKALEAKDDERIRFLMQYWVVYMIVEVLEVFADFLLFWIPMYYLLKVGFVYYLLSGKFRGAERVYSLLQPHLQKVAPTLDDIMENSASLLSNSAAAVAGMQEKDK